LENRIHLKKRDFEILSALELWGVLGLGQVEGAFFRWAADRLQRARLLFNEGYRHKGIAYRRLHKLERSGYIRIHRFVGHGQVYGLSEKGHRTLKQHGISRLPGYLKWVSPFTLPHRIAVAGAGLFLEKSLDIQVRGEREEWYRQKRLKRERKIYGELLVPDLTLFTATGRHRLEVELHQKSDKRYKKLWERYRDWLSKGDKVLYLVPSEQRMKGLLELARTGYFPHIFVLDLPAFRESLGEASFSNKDGEAVTIPGLNLEKKAAGQAPQGDVERPKIDSEGEQDEVERQEDRAEEAQQEDQREDEDDGDDEDDEDNYEPAWRREGKSDPWHAARPPGYEVKAKGPEDHPEYIRQMARWEEKRKEREERERLIAEERERMWGGGIMGWLNKKLAYLVEEVDS